MMGYRAYVGVAAALLAACGGSGVQSLQGSWTGTIRCFGDTSDLNLGLLVEGEKLRGSGQIRTKGSNANYTVSGTQANVDRVTECKDPFCTTDAQCVNILDVSGKTGKSRCSNTVCNPCYEKEPWLQVSITLKDENPQLSDPVLLLWRFGERRLEGTVQSFCPDEALQSPEVKVNKN